MDKNFDKGFSRTLDEMDKVKEAQRFVEISAQSVHDIRETYHRLASDFDEAVGALNEGQGCIHKLIEEMITAASAMSIGTGDRGENEQDYLKKALALPNKVLTEKDREQERREGGQNEIVAVGSHVKRWRSYAEGSARLGNWWRKMRWSSRVGTG